MASPKTLMAGYRVTTAVQAHADVLSGLQEAAYSPQGERFWPAKSFSETLVSHGVMAKIIEVDDIPVGFCVLRQIVDEAEILTIGILPAYQKQGLGKALLQDCINDLTNTMVKTIYLEVRANNIGAICTYRSCEFIEKMTRKNYYRLENGLLIDAIIYCLDMKK